MVLSYEFDHTKFAGKSALHNNYAISYVGNLNVKKAPLTAVIDDKTKVYGDQNPTATGTITGGWKNEDSLGHLNNNGVYNGTYTGGWTHTVDNPLDPDHLANVGVYTDSIVSNFDFTNYEVVPTKKGTLTITKADLTYTPNDQNKIYGELNPDLSTSPDYSDKGSFAGWKGHDSYNALHNGTVTGSLSLGTSATQTSDTGDYDIVASSDLDFTNYNVTYNKGTLTIKKADLYFNADGEHYLGDPITINDFNLTAAETATDATASQRNDGKLKSWDAVSATNLKTLKEFAKDGDDALVLYMIDKNGNRSLINNMTEVLFDANNNVIGYKLLDGSFQRADGTYQLVSRNYIMKFQSADDKDFLIKNPDTPKEAAFNAAKYYGDWGNERRGTIRYLTVKGSGITRK